MQGRTPRPLALLLAAIALAGCTATDNPAATSETAEVATGDRARSLAAFPLVLQEVAVRPDDADLGQDLTARAVVKNIGTAAATAKVEFLLADEVEATSFVTLEPGASTLVAGTIRPGRTGTLPVEARLVESGQVLRTTLLVHGPDLVDANVTLVELQQCDRVAHRVSFRNAGDGAAIAVRVEAQLRDTDGAIVDRLEQAVGDLDPGEGTLVEFTHIAPARCPVRHTYTVHVVATAQAGVTMEHRSAPFTV